MDLIKPPVLWISLGSAVDRYINETMTKVTMAGIKQKTQKNMIKRGTRPNNDISQKGIESSRVALKRAKHPNEIIIG